MSYQDYLDGLRDGALDLPYSARKRLKEYELIMPKTPPLVRNEEPIIPKYEPLVIDHFEPFRKFIK